MERRRTIENVFHQAEQERPELILLNFERVDSMHSIGIARIIGLLAQPRKRPLVARTHSRPW
jgi:hypothetical protein